MERPDPEFLRPQWPQDEIRVIARKSCVDSANATQFHRGEAGSLKKYPGVKSRISAILPSYDAPILVAPNSQAVTC